jgi:hypothetical protein
MKAVAEIFYIHANKKDAAAVKEVQRVIIAHMVFVNKVGGGAQQFHTS